MKDLRCWVRAAVCSYQVHMHFNHVARYLNTDSKTFSIQRKRILWVSKQIYIHGSPKRLNLTSRSLAVVTSRLMWGMELSRRPIIFNLFLAQRQQTMKLFPLSVRTKKCTTIAKKWMASCNGKNKSFKGKSSRWNTLLRVGGQNANWES